MTEAWPPFDLVIAYTDGELDAYMRTVGGRGARIARPPWGLWTIILGAVGALAGAFVAEALHSARPRDGRVVLILFALYWLGVYAELARLAFAGRRARRFDRDALRSALRDARLRVSSRGVSVRLRDERAHYRWSAFEEVSYVGGLILLHTPPGHALAVPLRLLSPEQRTRLIASADPEDPFS